MATKIWIEWVEQFGVDDDAVWMRVEQSTAIKYIQKAHPELTDEQALDEFIAVNWANTRVEEI